MRKTTRQRILETIYKNRTMTINSLHIALGVTKADIRHHLEILLSENLISIVAKIRNGRGRPADIFGVSQSMRGEATSLISSLLLAEIQNSKVEKDNQMRTLGIRMSERIFRKNDDSLHKQLSYLMECINEYHYRARWEASGFGAKLIFEHCPFHIIIGEHPELCLIDRYFLEECLHKNVMQINKIEPLEIGLSRCEFLIT